jgi:hypothetical protein
MTACEVCGGPLRADNKVGVCMRNPGCRQEHDQRSHLRNYQYQSRPCGICEVCGGPTRLPNKTSVCTHNPDCRRERYRREYEADPERKLARDRRSRIAKRPERERRAAETARAREAERAQKTERALELRKQGWSIRAIQYEVQLWMPVLRRILKDTPARTCSICGAPMGAHAYWGICQRTPECKRAQSELARRGRCARQGQSDTDLTRDYLASIYTGFCARLDCGKKLTPGSDTPRKDSPSLDRIIPAKGYMRGNVRWLCMACNQRKLDMTAQDMLAMLLDQMQAEGKSWADLVDAMSSASIQKRT